MPIKITIMKSILSIAFCILFTTVSFSQNKVGTINNDYIINLMPEAKIVVKRAQDYGAKLDSSFSIKMKEFKTKVDKFRKEEKEMGELLKKTTVKELTAMENDIKKYQDNGNKLMQLKQNELMRPLYKKLNDAVAAIAKENGYSQILTINGNGFAYISESHDITKLVMAKLGIKEPEAKK